MARSTLAARVSGAAATAVTVALCAGLLSSCDSAIAETSPHPHGTNDSGGHARTGNGTSGPNRGTAGAGGATGGNTGGNTGPAGTPDPRGGADPNGTADRNGDRAAPGTGADRQATPGREHPDRTRQGAPMPAAPNPNCTLVVPPAPLTAKGLATPYRLTATDRDAGACHESNADQSAFVEATILDPATGALSVYHPLVVDDGTDPAVAPVFPSLPPGAVVGVWFGFQGDVLTLRGDTAGCVNGLPGSPFGQFADCGAAAFFTAANASITARRTVVPPLGTAVDGKPCPTTRDFSVVDQDQSDNLATTYVATRGRTAQDNAAGRALPGVKLLTNASDNGLLVGFIDPALGCRPFTAPDLSGDGAQSPSLALNELQAAAFQAAPVAMVPTNDPMALRNDRRSVDKTNLYRQGVDMAPLPPGSDDGAAYCADLRTVAPSRLALDRQWTVRAPSPAPDEARNLFDFLVQRLTASWQELKCRGRAPTVPGAGRGGDR